MAGAGKTGESAGVTTVRATLEICRYDPDLDAAPAAASAPVAAAVSCGARAPVGAPRAPVEAPANLPRSAARRQRYEVELPVGSTVLEALMYVQDHVDGSLAFRRSCRHGICGSCGMRVNGCARLACTTQLSVAVVEAERRAAHVATMAAARAPAAATAATATAATGPLVRIEPLGNLPVIKDLVTDMAVFWEKLRSVRPWLQSLDERSGGAGESLMAPHQQAVLAEGVLCVECGACYSDCVSVDASPEFVGPTALVKAYRYAYDVRDDQTYHRLYDLDGEHGIWECTRCYTCTQRCPKHLRVRELIGRLAELAQVEGLRTDAAVKRAHAFVKGIERTGRLDERTLGLDTVGALRAAADAPAVARAVAAGKVRPGTREPVSDVELVRRVCGRLSDGTAGLPGPSPAAAPHDRTPGEERT